MSQRQAASLGLCRKDLVLIASGRGLGHVL